MDRRLGAIYGFCIGDALGVPAEFNSRDALHINPVETMQNAEDLGLPAGTWSDDSSMMLCLTDSLAEGLDYEDMMVRYYRWANFGDYTATGKAFGIGKTTLDALRNFSGGKPALECGCTGENDNGNGSLMRCLPLAFYLEHIKDEATRADIIHKTSSCTHATKRCLIACNFYVSLCMELLQGRIREVAAESALWRTAKYYKAFPEYKAELAKFRFFDGFGQFIRLDDSEISSTGYVVDTLEAALWCFYNTHSYRACVLRAVNLGDDTDTVAALAGALAGIYYGFETIPSEWVNALQGKELINSICEKFFKAMSKLVPQN